MVNDSGIVVRVRAAADRKVLFLPHAMQQMTSQERMITTKEVRSVIDRGEVIEDYPEDPRGHSCLILGEGDENRSIHVVCAPKEDFLAIITAYLPHENEWNDNFKVRRRS